MNNVVALNKNAKNSNEFIEILADLMATARRGEMKSFMHFTEAAGVNRIGVAGGFKDRLQYTLYTLVKGLNVVTDQIVESGTAGFSEAANSDIDERPSGDVEQVPIRLRKAK